MSLIHGATLWRPEPTKLRFCLRELHLTPHDMSKPLHPACSFSFLHRNPVLNGIHFTSESGLQWPG